MTEEYRTLNAFELGAFDGADFEASAEAVGFQAHWAWGRNGYDTPQFPYVRYMSREREDGRGDALEYVEGDIYWWTFDTYAEAIAKIDDSIEWHWRQNQGSHGVPGLPEGEGMPPELCGPFSWVRLDAEKEGAA